MTETRVHQWKLAEILNDFEQRRIFARDMAIAVVHWFLAMRGESCVDCTANKEQIS